MGKTINKFVAESFVNELGQTINPGDLVAYVIHNHRVYTGKAKFAGVFKNDKGKVVSTKVIGTISEKWVETGEVETVTYKDYDWKTSSYVERSYDHKVRIKVSCEPYGYSILQCNRLFKIEG